MTEFSMLQNGQKSTKWVKMDKNGQKRIKMGKTENDLFLLYKIDCKHLYCTVVVYLRQYSTQFESTFLESVWKCFRVSFSSKGATVGGK